MNETLEMLYAKIVEVTDPNEFAAWLIEKNRLVRLEKIRNSLQLRICYEGGEESTDFLPKIIKGTRLTSDLVIAPTCILGERSYVWDYVSKIGSWDLISLEDFEVIAESIEEFNRMLQICHGDIMRKNSNYWVKVRQNEFLSDGNHSKFIKAYRMDGLCEVESKTAFAIFKLK